MTREHLTGEAITASPVEYLVHRKRVERQRWRGRYELDRFGRLRSLNGQALEQYFADAEAQRSARTLVASRSSRHNISC